MKAFRRVLSILLTVAILSGISPVPASAASFRKCYTISSGNTTVYSNTRLTKKYGTIYGSDEVTVLLDKDANCKVRYPITRARTKTVYIRTTRILTQTGGSSKRSSGKITTYRRPGGASYGYISKNDTVKVLGVHGNYTQVKYPVSGGYKYAFITTANARKYILSGSSNNNGGNDVAAIAEGTYVMRSALNHNKVVDAYGIGSVKNGTNIQLCSYNGGENQRYTITAAGGGWYKIICNWGNKAMEVHGGAGGNNKNVSLWDYHGGAGQLWRFRNAGNNYYYIESRLGYYLDVCGGGTADETNILIYQLNRGNNQKWKLEPASSSQPPSQTSQADALVNMAKSQVGIKERSAGSDDILYNDWYYGRRVKNSKTGFYPWCASFVSWCAYQTGILNSVIPKTAGTTNMKNGLISRGGTQHLKNSGYRPVHGDIIFFGSNAGQHVGIVDYTSGNTVYYIDGNNTTTTPHGVKYSSCSLSYKSLWGFVTPRYQR